MDNPFFRDEYEFALEPENIEFGISPRGAHVAIILNKSDDLRLIFERVDDESPSGYTWWCCGTVEDGRVKDVFEPAPLNEALSTIAAIEQQFQKVPKEVRDSMRAHFTSQN
jgi:hypothetical protein